MIRKTSASANLPLKKKSLGQNFLRKQSVVDAMIEGVALTPETTVFEIGCGDGFLSQAILENTPCKKLLIIEVDPEWAAVVQKKLAGPRLEMKVENILNTELNKILSASAHNVMLANLPYNITFPILHILQKNRALFAEGIFMIQEEVAQKLAAKKGRSCGFISHYFQHFFDFKLLQKIEPAAFEPAPKVFSRLVHFKPLYPAEMANSEQFWNFIRACFRSPRQMLKNNLKATPFEAYNKLASEAIGAKRAQELTFQELLAIWNLGQQQT